MGAGNIIEENSRIFSLIRIHSCYQQGHHACSKNLLRQNPPVLNWKCRLTQVVMYNGCKMVVVVNLWPPCIAGCGHIYFRPVSFFLLFFPRLISAVADWMSTILPHMVWPYCEFRMQVWNVVHAARCKYRQQKIAILAPSHVVLCLRNYGTYRQSGKNFLSSNISSTCPHNMVNFGPLTAEIVSLVWGTPVNFNGICVLAALLCSTSVISVSQTLRCWTEGATYIREGGHHVGHWPTFLVQNCFD